MTATGTYSFNQYWRNREDKRRKGKFVPRTIALDAWNAAMKDNREARQRMHRQAIENGGKVLCMLTSVSALLEGNNNMDTNVREELMRLCVLIGGPS